MRFLGNHLGAEIPLGPLLAEVAREVGAVALEALRQALRREVSNVDLVVLAGGGGSLYGEQAAALFPGAAVRLAPDPVAANARGFFHYGAR
jgi:plasmid segregation protein ParM